MCLCWLSCYHRPFVRKIADKIGWSWMVLLRPEGSQVPERPPLEPGHGCRLLEGHGEGQNYQDACAVACGCWYEEDSGFPPWPRPKGEAHWLDYARVSHCGAGVRSGACRFVFPQVFFYLFKLPDRGDTLIGFDLMFSSIFLLWN